MPQTPNRLYPGAPTPLPNPEQVLINLLAAISCKLDQVILNTGGDTVIGTTVNTIKEKSTRLVDARVTVKSTVTPIRPASTDRISIIIQNRGLDRLFIGDSTNVTITDNLCIEVNESWSSDTYLGPIYGISDGGSLDVRVQEELK